MADRGVSRRQLLLATGLMALAALGPGPSLAGEAMIAVASNFDRTARELEARDGVGPLQSRDDLFSDNIHFSDYGAYLMALTHYAVLYQTGVYQGTTIVPFH